MFYGYARISTKEQNLARQKKILKENGVKKENIYEETASGKDFQSRVAYYRMLEECRVGDTIFFTSIDRFSRNTAETIKELERLEKRGINVRFINEKIDTSFKGISQLLINIFSWYAEQEREKIRERQRQGYNSLQKDSKGRLIGKNGKVLGKPELKLNKNQLKLLEEYKQGKLEVSKTDLAKLLGISRSALYKKVLTNEISK